MSAFLCSPIHIAALAREMTRPIVVLGGSPHVTQVAVDAEAGDVAADLAAANWESVSYRYAHDPAPSLAPYGTLAVYEDGAVYAAQHVAMRRLTLVRLYGALACYEYQSCEHPGWPQSKAYAHCEAMRRLLLMALAHDLAAQRDIEPGWSLQDAEVLA